MKPTLTIDADIVRLEASIGFSRLLLDQARQNAQSFVMAAGLSHELKGRWQKRVTEFNRLLALLPPPADLREPYSEDADMAHVLDQDDRNPQEGWDGKTFDSDLPVDEDEEELDLLA